MPSTRRMKTIATALVIAFCYFLFLSRDTTTPQFYSRTVAALEKKEASDREAAAASKLRTIKDASTGQEPVRGEHAPQKSLAASDTDNGSSHVDVEVTGEGAAKEASSERDTDEEKSVAGRKKMKGGEVKNVHSGAQSPMYKDKSKEDTPEKKEPHKTKAERELEAEMNSILKRGPIIIFSKSYCPYSTKAKRILTDKYTIVPKPHIVELDHHPLGAGLQNALEKTTGRRTVPNILINGKSIGGGDDIESAEIAGTLIEKIKNMGGKRIMEVTQRRKGD